MLGGHGDVGGLLVRRLRLRSATIRVLSHPGAPETSMMASHDHGRGPDRSDRTGPQCRKEPRCSAGATARRDSSPAISPRRSNRRQRTGSGRVQCTAWSRGSVSAFGGRRLMHRRSRGIAMSIWAENPHGADREASQSRTVESAKVKSARGRRAMTSHLNAW